MKLEIYLKCGETFTFETNISLTEIATKLNKNEFICFGSMIFKTSEIMYIETI
jgi:hypothetical protein